MIEGRDNIGFRGTGISIPRLTVSCLPAVGMLLGPVNMRKVWFSFLFSPNDTPTQAPLVSEVASAPSSPYCTPKKKNLSQPSETISTPTRRQYQITLNSLTIPEEHPENLVAGNEPERIAEVKKERKYLFYSKCGLISSLVTMVALIILAAVYTKGRPFVIAAVGVCGISAALYLGSILQHCYSLKLLKQNYDHLKDALALQQSFSP